MAPVASVVAGSALGPMKNGYRTPPPGPATPATPASGAMFDPSAGAAVATTYQNSPQRFLFTNGTHLPPSVNYGNQVQIYVSPNHTYLKNDELATMRLAICGSNQSWLRYKV